MIVLSKAECYRILELDPKANSYEVETRYTMLIKRYRGQNDPETMKKLEEITLAYDILTNRYVEPEPVDPRMEEMVFGKTRRDWKNKWHYGKMPLLGFLIGAFLLGSLIYSIVTNEPPDFQLVVAGQFAAADDADKRIETYIRDSIDGVETVEYQVIPLSFAETGTDETGGTSTNIDPESEYAYVMKMMTMIAGETIEMFVCEKSVFDQYAPQGTFKELDQLYARLQDLPEDILARIKPLRRILIDVYEEQYPDGNAPWDDEEAMNQDESLPIYGLDVSELHLMEGVGLYGKTQIMTIGFNAGDAEQTEAFLEYWIRDYEKMHADRQAYEDALKAKANS